MNFCILGAGAWGTAMAVHLARNGQTTTLVPRHYEQALTLASERENKLYLPGIELEQEIQISCETMPALMEAEVVLIACPVAGLNAIANSINEVLPSAWRAHTFLTLCKGWEADSSLPPPSFMKRHLKDHQIGVLSGPNNAMEVAEGKPAAIVLATDKNSSATSIQKAISDEKLRVYTSNDVTGVSLGGALKNIYAIGAGICVGLGLGDNATAAFLTRALHEMVKIGAKLGGRVESFYGLSGFGDLIATSTGNWSRNRTFGVEIGKGNSVEKLLLDRRTVVEGFNATETFHQICKQKKIESPILEETFGILHEGKSPSNALHKLMTRNLRDES